MTREKFWMKPLLALLATTLLGVGIGGCGGVNKSRSLPSRVPSTAAAGGAQTTTAPIADARGTKAKGGAASESGEDASDIYTYKHSASPADRRAITALVKRYYVAAAADNGAEACGMMYSILAESIPETYGRPPGPPELRGKTCAVVMSKLFKHVAGQPPPVLAATKVTGMHLVGVRKGLVELHSTAMSIGEIEVERERGVWKIAGLIGRACTYECASG
jgi:hypothetical protein